MLVFDFYRANGWKDLLGDRFATETASTLAVTGTIELSVGRDPPPALPRALSARLSKRGFLTAAGASASGALSTTLPHPIRPTSSHDVDLEREGQPGPARVHVVNPTFAAAHVSTGADRYGDIASGSKMDPKTPTSISTRPSNTKTRVIARRTAARRTDRDSQVTGSAPANAAAAQARAAAHDHD
jgi:hypothetical protein